MSSYICSDPVSYTHLQAGNDVILTIDMDLQKAAYQILEQYIAGIICAKLADTEEFNACLLYTSTAYNPFADIRSDSEPVYFTR